MTPIESLALGIIALWFGGIAVLVAWIWWRRR